MTRNASGALPLILCTALAAWCTSAHSAEAELRGIWMHATQVKSRADADQWVAKLDRANLNAVFMLVWYWGGQAFYRSDLCPMGDGVEKGYDPLIAAFSGGPYRGKVGAYRPPARKAQ